METKILKCGCPFCGQPVDYEEGAAGAPIRCGQCGESFKAPAYERPPIHAARSLQHPIGRIKTGSRPTAGSRFASLFGILLMLAGAAAAGAFLLGKLALAREIALGGGAAAFVIGWILRRAGKKAAIRHVCSNCGALLKDRDVSVCRSCEARLIE